MGSYHVITVRYSFPPGRWECTCSPGYVWETTSLRAARIQAEYHLQHPGRRIDYRHRWVYGRAAVVASMAAVPVGVLMR